MKETTPPQPPFYKDVAAQCQSLDLMSAERLGAQRLLQKAHALFPLAKAGMDANFKGTHGLRVNEKGDLVIDIWWQGLSWPVKFCGTPEMPDRLVLPANFPPVEQLLGQGKP